MARVSVTSHWSGGIRSEYLEMPGLRLTPLQAARLWTEDTVSAERLLSELAATGFIYRDRTGAYVRRSVA
jgi:hypothetical protein